MSGSAFPYVATAGTPAPGDCDANFAWGYTVSGTATGQATWDAPLWGNWMCTASAWIPDKASNDPNAQYYIFDGSKYLANDAYVNQENTTNNWAVIANGTWFHITDHMRITLNDHNPMGEAGWAVAAYAIGFECTN